MNLSKIKRIRSSKNKANIPFPLCGYPMYMIIRLIGKHKFFLIASTVQASQTLGNERKAKSFGPKDFFSSYVNNGIGASRVAVVTGDRKVVGRLPSLKNHGLLFKDNYYIIRRNNSMTSIQSTVLSTRLNYLDRRNSLR